jgi:hypothetical protein
MEKQQLAYKEYDTLIINPLHTGDMELTINSLQTGGMGEATQGGLPP